MGREMKCEGKGRGGEGRREEGRGGSRLQKYFGLEPHLAVWEQTWVAKANHVLDVMPIDATWRIRLNAVCAAAMRPCIRLL